MCCANIRKPHSHVATVRQKPQKPIEWCTALFVAVAVRHSVRYFHGKLQLSIISIHVGLQASLTQQNQIVRCWFSEMQ